VVIALGGELDMATAAELEHRVDGVLADSTRAMTLDLTELTFVDSSGIAALARAQNRARAHGLAFAIEGVSAPVRRILELSGMLTELALEPDGDDE
jgi:anti-sigma B factor antagonist